MENDDDLLENQSDEEEGLFDLSLDDLTPDDDDVGQESAKEKTDDEIIELMELVEKGEKDFGENGDGFAQVPLEEQPTKEMGNSASTDDETTNGEELSNQDEALSQTDMDLVDISLETDVSLLTEDAPETVISEEDISGDNIDNVLEEESNRGMAVDEAPEEPIEQDRPEEPVEDMNLTIQSPIDSPEATASIEAEAKHADGTDEKAFEEPDKIIPVSEEKIEEIVTRVVGDIVERVARETMAEVAEKVINEAIDALKQSINKNSN